MISVLIQLQVYHVESGQWRDDYVVKSYLSPLRPMVGDRVIIESRRYTVALCEISFDTLVAYVRPEVKP